MHANMPYTELRSGPESKHSPASSVDAAPPEASSRRSGNRKSFVQRPGFHPAVLLLDEEQSSGPDPTAATSNSSKRESTRKMLQRMATQGPMDMETENERKHRKAVDPIKLIAEAKAALQKDAMQSETNVRHVRAPRASAQADIGWRDGGASLALHCA